MKRFLLLTTLFLAAPAMAQKPAPNAFSDRLAQLNDMQRFAVLRRAVIDAGEICKRVTASNRQGSLRNLVMWTVRCAPATDYGVFIGTDGSVQVRRCSEHAQLKLPLCRIPTGK